MLKQRNYNLDDHVFEENDLDDKLLDDDELVNGQFLLNKNLKRNG